MPPIKVFCVGASLIKNHTHRGPKAVSSKKKIPTSGELMNCGAILINTKDTPTVTIINDKSIKSVELIMKLLTKNTATQAVKSFPNIYGGTKLILGELLITVKLPPTKAAHRSP